jgi:uncharacterized protein (DUF983 family)
MFPSPFTYRMQVLCRQCGLQFEPDPGEMTGGMAINMVLTSVLGTAGAIYFAVFTTTPMGWTAFGLGAAATVFGLLFHRPARGLWVSVLYVTGAIYEPGNDALTPRPPARAPSGG